jgi:hypothetical protein
VSGGALLSRPQHSSLVQQNTYFINMFIVILHMQSTLMFIYCGYKSTAVKLITPQVQHGTDLHYFPCNVLNIYQTSRRVWMVSTPASDSGVLRLKSRPRDRVSWEKFSWFFSVAPGKYWDSTIN